MADTLDILTLEEAYRAINNASATGHDLELAQWITGVSRRIDDVCGPVVVRTITAELHDGGDMWIRPRHTPVSSVTSITEYDRTDATALTAEDNSTKPDDGYLLDDRGGHDQRIIRRSDNADVRFAAGRRNITVTYVAGRAADTSSVDPKFKAAAGAILRRIWSRDGGAWSRGGDPFDQSTPVFFDAFKQAIKEYLHDELVPFAVH